jgi:hypothetical protein
MVNEIAKGGCLPVAAPPIGGVLINAAEVAQIERAARDRADHASRIATLAKSAEGQKLGFSPGAAARHDEFEAFKRSFAAPVIQPGWAGGRR